MPRQGTPHIGPEIMASQSLAEATDWSVAAKPRSGLRGFTTLLHLPRMGGHDGGLQVRNRPALAGHGAEAARDAIARAVTSLPGQMRRSLTENQGAELAQHARLRIGTGVTVRCLQTQQKFGGSKYHLRAAEFSHRP